MSEKQGLVFSGGHSMAICKCGRRFEGSGARGVKRAEKAMREHVCEERPAETRTFWLSFCDGTKPIGKRNLGICVVDVTTADFADAALLDVWLRFPLAQEDSQWEAAATIKAHREGCNPGGEIAFADITDRLQYAPATVPRNRLMSFAELEALGLQPITQADLDAKIAERES